MSANWIEVCRVDDIPVLGARVLEVGGGDNIAVFRSEGDRVFAVRDRCPHKGGPLSQGIVAGDTVTCPLHAWNLSLESGEARAPDVGCVATYPVRVEEGVVWLSLTQAIAPTDVAAAHAQPAPA
jgi:nitrite reductase (NADH) small subunit